MLWQNRRISLLLAINFRRFLLYRQVSVVHVSRRIHAHPLLVGVPVAPCFVEDARCVQPPYLSRFVYLFVVGFGWFLQVIEVEQVHDGLGLGGEPGVTVIFGVSVAEFGVVEGGVENLEGGHALVQFFVGQIPLERSWRFVELK